MLRQLGLEAVQVVDQRLAIASASSPVRTFARPPLSLPWPQEARPVAGFIGSSLLFEVAASSRGGWPVPRHSAPSNPDHSARSSSNSLTLSRVPTMRKQRALRRSGAERADLGVERGRQPPPRCGRSISGANSPHRSSSRVTARTMNTLGGSRKDRQGRRGVVVLRRRVGCTECWSRALDARFWELQDNSGSSCRFRDPLGAPATSNSPDRSSLVSRPEVLLHSAGAASRGAALLGGCILPVCALSRLARRAHRRPRC